MSSAIRHPSRSEILAALRDYHDKKYKSLGQAADAHNIPRSTAKHHWNQLKDSGVFDTNGTHEQHPEGELQHETTASESDPKRPTKKQIDSAKVRAYQLYERGAVGNRTAVKEVKKETDVDVDVNVVRTWCLRPRGGTA